MIVVLPLKPDRVGQALAFRPFRALFFEFSPHPVLGASGDLAGQFLWRAQMVALVPGQQAHRLVAQCLGHRDEGAGFVEVVDGFVARAVGLRRAAFPGQGVAVPAEQGETAPQFALFARLFVAVPLRAGFASV